MNLGNYNGSQTYIHCTVMLGHRLPVFSMLHTANTLMQLKRIVVHVYHWWGAEATMTVTAKRMKNL